MSLKYEQARAIKRTRQFLGMMLWREDVSEELKEMVRSCIHHFPSLTEYGIPIFSKDEFTNEDGSVKE